MYNITKKYIKTKAFELVFKIDQPVYIHNDELYIYTVIM